MRVVSFVVFAACLILAACGQGKPTVAGGEQVRAYMLEHPEVIEEAMTKLQEKRQAAADAELSKVLAASKKDLESDGRDFVAGNPDGKITMVEFFDYRCPYCKVSRPEIAKFLAANKDVRLVMKEYPILSPASEAAARAALGAKAQGKYWPVHEGLMGAQELNGPEIDRILAGAGVDLAKAKAVGTSAAATNQLEDIRALARATGVTGTPAFVIDDVLVPGWDPERIAKAVVDARKG